jgi:hypothetical protein
MILQAKSKFGAHILEKFGTEWVLIKRANSYYMAKKPGPWGLIQPVDSTQFEERWIHLVDDKNFEIVRKR